MEKEKIDFMEVKPIRKGFYSVTLYQFKKDRESDPEYIRASLEFDGEDWMYGEYSGHCYVCYVHRFESRES